MKLYFSSSNDDLAWTKEAILSEMKEYNIQELTVFEAVKDKSKDYFYCKEFQEIGESNNCCGKICSKYLPRNKKSGCCVHRGFTYEEGQAFILNINGKIKKIQ
jgi:hypothetical protein